MKKQALQLLLNLKDAESEVPPMKSRIHHGEDTIGINRDSSNGKLRSDEPNDLPTPKKSRRNNEQQFNLLEDIQSSSLDNKNSIKKVGFHSSSPHKLKFPPNQHFHYLIPHTLHHPTSRPGVSYSASSNIVARIFGLEAEAEFEAKFMRW